MEDFVPALWPGDGVKRLQRLVSQGQQYGVKALCSWVQIMKSGHLHHW